MQYLHPQTRYKMPPADRDSSPHDRPSHGKKSSSFTRSQGEDFLKLHQDIDKEYEQKLK